MVSIVEWVRLFEFCLVNGFLVRKMGYFVVYLGLFSSLSEERVLFMLYNIFFFWISLNGLDGWILIVLFFFIYLLIFIGFLYKYI